MTSKLKCIDCNPICNILLTAMVIIFCRKSASWQKQANGMEHGTWQFAVLNKIYQFLDYFLCYSDKIPLIYHIFKKILLKLYLIEIFPKILCAIGKKFCKVFTCGFYCGLLEIKHYHFLSQIAISASYIMSKRWLLLWR